MGDEKDDAQYFVTCTHCGTQTALSLRQLEDNRPVKCRVCGAPFKIVPPPTRPSPKRKKRSGDYYLLHAERVEYERWVDGEYRGKSGKTVGIVILIIKAAALLTLIIISLVKGC